MVAPSRSNAGTRMLTSEQHDTNRRQSCFHHLSQKLSASAYSLFEAATLNFASSSFPNARRERSRPEYAFPVLLSTNTKTDFGDRASTTATTSHPSN